jgi:hypothetical protein
LLLHLLPITTEREHELRLHRATCKIIKNQQMLQGRFGQAMNWLFLLLQTALAAAAAAGGCSVHQRLLRPALLV